MFKNYLKIAFRNLLRHKIFSFINIFGLALGMTCSILIMLWVRDELRFNRFHANLNDLYRVIEEQHYPGGENLTMSSTPGTLAEALKKEFPEVSHATKVSWDEQVLFTHGDKSFKETGNYVSPDFLRMFSFSLVAGNANTALNQPNSVVITETLAKKYFGTTQVLGQVFKINNADSYKITGVLRDVPKNSSLQFSYLMPVNDYEAKPDKQWLKSWDSNGIRTFVQLHPNATKAGLDPKIEEFITQNSKQTHIKLFLQPVKDMYLRSDFQNDRVGGGRIAYVRLFSVVAVFVLLIACINFMNLSTARSAKRAKEVGVRKVIGAVRSVLVGQFIGESMLISLLAIFISIGLTQLFLPAFNEFTGKSIMLGYAEPAFWGSLLGIALITGLVAGSYPALFLSSFKPVTVLKGTLKFSNSVALFRKGLVVFQFVLSAILIISTLVVYRQVEYIRSKNIGLSRENVAYVSLEGDLSKNAEAFKNQLAQAPGIKAVGAANQSPIAVGNNGGGVAWRGKDPGIDILFSFLQTDYGFPQTLDVQLKEGRFFSKEFGADSSKVLVNEEAVRIMGFKEPLGEKITLNGQEVNIVGVVKDFHVTSLHAPMQPLLIFLSPQNANFLFVRTEAGKTKEALASLENLTKRFNPNYPFNYRFLDEDFEQMYRSEAVIGKLANYFAGIAIVISCLGLFGLALFTAEQRTKEIGIRKVLGASVSGIVAMLSKDFLKLVLIANLIAWPLGWYLMHNWLQNYAFRADMGWWIFVLAGGATLLIALLTVSFQAVRAALTNPVQSLRSE
ncbi:ABC transporter permease [Adhaeribacter rhizoryzae]|uniref:FtsX-like permease family protein n=1 Tax=Adhaeribacter rhizoryzae TaxID=2607907 RepID=A0A5M6D989_9BACT|nr:ABC transporter permease [Adhaeribacter rhizoryzae]KAA5542852.1 FtsX-like permease family protein [Adhaeribacter rhizoryzae]